MPSSPTALSQPDDPILDTHALNRLKWRCRRGLLENDLFLDRFFSYQGIHLTQGQASIMEELMQMGDNELLDVFLGKLHPKESSHPALAWILQKIRTNIVK